MAHENNRNDVNDELSKKDKTDLSKYLRGIDGHPCIHFGADDLEHIRADAYNRFRLLSQVRCDECSVSLGLDPWWKFDETSRDAILIYLRSVNENNLCTSEECNKNNSEDIRPAKFNRYGMLNRVWCKKCNKEQSIKIHIRKSQQKTRIQAASELERGDEIAWPRMFGYSHHAVYIGQKPSDNVSLKKEETSTGCCCWSDEKIYVISHTPLDDEPKIIQTQEWLRCGNVYRIEYDRCHNRDFTVRMAEEAAGKPNGPKYDPLMENCEHFARVSKTIQSESGQVSELLGGCWRRLLLILSRILSIVIWMFCEALIGDNHTEVTTESPMIPDNASREENATTKGWPVCITGNEMSQVELRLSIALFVTFAILHTIYIIYRECKKIKRYNHNGNQRNNTGSQATAKGNRSRNEDSAERHCRLPCSYRCCKRCCGIVPNVENTPCCFKCCKSILSLICLIFCEAPGTLCIACGKRCRRCIYASADAWRFYCKNYGMIAVRIVVREVIALGAAAAVFSAYQCNYGQYNKSWVVAGIATALAVPGMLAGLFVGTIISNGIQYCCCIRCRCCRYRRQGDGTVQSPEIPLSEKSSSEVNIQEADARNMQS